MTDLIKAADALAEAVNEQLSYMDLCGDKGDLERNMRNALTAYRQARESADGVKVKPLVWEYLYEYGLYCQAVTSIGTYSIHQDEDSAGGAMLMYLHLTKDGDCTKYAIEWHDYVDPEEFQAIAQADYEARIKAALDT